MSIRPSPIAGQWYPGEAAVLARSIEAYLAAAQPPALDPPGEVIALMAPHAGHLYSGPVAACAFQTVRGAHFDVVVVLCPSHFHADGPVLTSGHSAYQTPLGQVPVDQTALTALRQALPGRPALPAIQRDREHAIEIELPFLQQVLAGEFQLIPLMVRDQTAEVARRLAEALVPVLRGRRALLIASTDLSHYFPQAAAQALDTEMLRQVEAFDPQGVLQTDAEGRGQACGAGALAATLWAAQALGADHVRVLHYATSGDVNGDYVQVVGYGAAALWRAAAPLAT